MPQQVMAWSFTVPHGDAGSSPADLCSYDPGLSRIRVDVAQAASGWPADATLAVERSIDLVRWETVRGGVDLPADPAGLPVDDYEFASGEQNHYRVRVYSDGALLATYTDALAAAVDELWLKFLPLAFLNTAVVGAKAGDVTRASRAGLFTVVGRPKPVAVSDARGPRTWELTLKTETKAEREHLDAALATGDVVFLQTPAGYPIPGGWYSAGDTTEARKDMPWDKRWWTLPLTETEAPGPDVLPVTYTWRALRRHYATWADVRAAFTAWRQIRDTVADPGDAAVS